MVQRLLTADLLPAGPPETDTPGMHPRRPLVVRVDWAGGDAVPTCQTSAYDRRRMHADDGAQQQGDDSTLAPSAGDGARATRDDGGGGASVEWALLEPATSDAPPVLLGVPRELLKGNLRASAAYAADTGAHAEDMGAHAHIADAYTHATGTAGIAAAQSVADSRGAMPRHLADSGAALLPAPTSEVAQVRLPASLLQKALRRGFCSPAPLLEACTALLAGSRGREVEREADQPPRGGAYALLCTIWGCMLVDASPFDAPTDGGALGLEQLIALSLVARADAGWVMPPALARKAVAAALRVQQRPANQWLGFMDRDFAPNGQIIGWRLEQPQGGAPAAEPMGAEGSAGAGSGSGGEGGAESGSHWSAAEARAIELRNVLVVGQAAIGGSIRWGRWDKFVGEPTGAALVAYLNPDFTEWYAPGTEGQPPRLHAAAVDGEQSLLDAWVGRANSPVPNLRVQRLDAECRLAAYDPHVTPSSLLLLQATLADPPLSWKKHSLPSLARQVRKLISEANPRLQERAGSMRVAMWGNAGSGATAVAAQGERQQSEKTSLPPLYCVLQTAKTDDAKQAASGAGASDSVVAPPAKVAVYSSAREVVTPTGKLSEKEIEIIECYEAVQRWQQSHWQRHQQPHLPHMGMQTGDGDSRVGATVSSAATANESVGAADGAAVEPKMVATRAVVGAPPSAYDGRTAFLLAFAEAAEIEVTPVDGPTEVVNVLFCGTVDEPLRVQRVGKARDEAASVVESGASGANAVPSLGYVQRSRSDGERRLIEAAERAVAARWAEGRRVSLPAPPPGFQWELGAAAGQEEEAEKSVELSAIHEKGSGWAFKIGGVGVQAFDARAVITPCSLTAANHDPLALDSSSQHAGWLRAAFYVKDAFGALPSGDGVMNVLDKLHAHATITRRKGAHEGQVYDWVPLALGGGVLARTWRDALLVLKTRDADHIVLGPVLADGSGSIRDMSEGVLIRLYYALEMLYPTALIKEGALRWRVRPRGAGYHHMLDCLERLGRSTGPLLSAGTPRPHVAPPPPMYDALPAPPTSVGSSSSALPAPPTSVGSSSSPTDAGTPLTSVKRRLQRSAAAAGVRATAAIATSEAHHGSGGDRGAPGGGGDGVGGSGGGELCNPATSLAMAVAVGAEDLAEYMPLPKVTTTLWPHQEASCAKIVQGVKEGRRGHADASAVGAGKTLTALATIVRLAAHIESKGKTRNGVLVMLPTKALIKEWLLEIAAHTSGFHVIEQREDGSLFSLTYGRSTPPIDGSSLIISTLDRVSEHPFIRQAAWDFVVSRPKLAERAPPRALIRSVTRARGGAVSPERT